ncbi:MAG TPA: creatininase family protein [Limnochordales bacterium]
MAVHAEGGAAGHPVRLVEMRRPQLEQRLQQTDLALVATGSVEQHGPHLPYGTDAFAAEVVAEALARRLNGVLLPFTPLGITPLHMAFKGTLTLRPETFMALLADVLDSAWKHGFRRFVVVNWHEGNIPAIQMSASRLVQQTGARVVLVQACYVAEEMFGHEVGGLTHGGEMEVLPVLLYNPQLVALAEAAQPSDRSQGQLMDRRRRSRGISLVIRDVREIAPTGWYGDPHPATVDKARRLFEQLADRVAGELRELLADSDGARG